MSSLSHNPLGQAWDKLGQAPAPLLTKEVWQPLWADGVALYAAAKKRTGTNLANIARRNLPHAENHPADEASAPLLRKEGSLLGQFTADDRTWVSSSSTIRLSLEIGP